MTFWKKEINQLKRALVFCTRYSASSIYYEHIFVYVRMKIVFGIVVSANIILNRVYSRDCVTFVILVTRYNSEFGVQVFEVHTSFYLLVVITFLF